jgi:hypothetical protein
MSLAIRVGENNDKDGVFIYFDAVSSYSQTYSGQVTKHPVDAGASIVDHFVKNNASFTITAIITGVDVSTGSYLIQDLEGNYPYNVNQAPTPVSVTSTDQSVLSQLIPDSIGQFLPNTIPDVIMDSARIDIIDQVRDSLIDLVSGSKLNETTGQFESNIQVVRLFEYNGTLLNRILNNLVITSIRFSEDANSGYALYCDITFEQVTFAFLKKTELPKNIRKSLEKKASAKKSVGKCDSTVKDPNNPNAGEEGKCESIVESESDIDPLRATRTELRN